MRIPARGVIGGGRARRHGQRLTFIKAFRGAAFFGGVYWYLTKASGRLAWTSDFTQGLQSRVAIPLVSTAPYRRDDGASSCREVCAMTLGYVFPKRLWCLSNMRYGTRASINRLQENQLN